MTDKTFALATEQTTDGARAAVVLGDRIAPLADVLPARTGATVRDLLDDWAVAEGELAQAVVGLDATAAPFRDMDEAQLLPPVNLPRQVFCTGANYRKHVVDLTLDMNVGPEGLDKAGLRRWAEDMMDTRAREGEPYVFLKPVSSIAGPNDPLAVPDYDEKPDWELELAVIIGKPTWQVSRDEAMEHVAGYAIVNDVTSRSLIARKDYSNLGTDWMRSKGQPGYLPFGPLMVPRRFVPDPMALTLKLSLNGDVMQDEAAADMIFDIPRQIEYISRYSRLMPGDVICTGSPAGNGTHYNRFLKPGDTMVGEIEGLGRQTINIVARD